MEEQIRFPELDKNCFRTPEGYFENFTDRMMAQLSKQETRHERIIRMRWWHSIAAVAIIAVSFASGWFLRDPVSVVSEKPVLQEESTAIMDLSDDELDAALNYEMVQNSDITYYLMVE